MRSLYPEEDLLRAAARGGDAPEKTADDVAALPYVIPNDRPNTRRPRK